MWKDRPTDGEKDGQTDMTKLIVAFRNFENAPKMNKNIPFIPGEKGNGKIVRNGS
jgi:hypothetical protein